MAEVRIELHNSGSGLLDTLSADSMPRLRELLIDKLERGMWNLRNGDTLKVIEGSEGYAYLIVKKYERHEDNASMVERSVNLSAYCASHTVWSGNWTKIWKRNGMWQKYPDDRKPKMWKSSAGAEAQLEKLLQHDKTGNFAIVRLRWED